MNDHFASVSAATGITETSVSIGKDFVSVKGSPRSKQQNKSSREMINYLECFCARPDKTIICVILEVPTLSLEGELALYIYISKESKNLN